MNKLEPITIFIDESGVHIQDGHSTVVLVYIITQDAENIKSAILNAEKSLKITSFHWYRHIWKIRKEFVKLLLKENFIVKSAIIQNPFKKNDFENALKHLLIEKKIQKIVIDGKKSKWYALRLKKVLRDQGISVKKIRTGKDESYPCLRLADAFAGLIRAYWNDSDNEKAREVYKLANKKITTQLVSGQIVR